MTTTQITYQTSNLDHALNAVEAEDGHLDAETIRTLYAAHLDTAAAASLLVFDLGEDPAARAVARPGARIVRTYLGEAV